MKQLEPITNLISQARERALRSVNKELINLYWQIGHYISSDTQKVAGDKQTVEHLVAYIASNNIDSKGFSTP
ncbi:MAG: DUF1016 N-terminal domain-containing protein [Burkholderiales bacterium]